MDSDRRYSWLPLTVLISALIIWTVLLAIGAYLEWGADQPRHDIRKPLMMLGSLGLFLAIWATALWLRSRRLGRKARRPDGVPPGSAPLD